MQSYVKCDQLANENPLHTVVFGLCGSHRSGKTTLAQAIADHMRLPFVQTKTSDVFKENGLDPAEPMDFNTRLWIQNRIIRAAEEIWQAESGSFVTDRTPIDMMAYTLADIQGVTDADFSALIHYMEYCFDAANRLFTHLAVIQPAIPLIYESGKAAMNRSYMEHLNTVVLGLCADERLNVPFLIVKRKILSVEDRVRTIIKFFISSDPYVKE